MFIKDLNLYINEKNIVTIQPYFTPTGTYGLNINGNLYEFGMCLKADKSLKTACLGKMKALQTQLIKRIEQ